MNDIYLKQDPKVTDTGKYCSYCGKKKEECECSDQTITLSIHVPPGTFPRNSNSTDIHNKCEPMTSSCTCCFDKNMHNKCDIQTNTSTCRCACCQPVCANGGNDGVRKIDEFKGAYPYATELFGIYQPLFGWIGQQNMNRVVREQSNNESLMERIRSSNTNITNISNFSDLFLNSLISVQSTRGSVVLSPIGLLDLYREYFFEFDSFLGSPNGHVWLSPGGTVELVEVQTRKQIVDRTIESSLEVTRKSEESLTQQDELSDAIKEENQNNTKLGASVSGGVNMGV